jgi:hypothetical protein
MEIRSITEICNFRRAPVVGVPIAKVANTLVTWLRWMAGSYVGRLDTKTTSLRSVCLKYLGLAIPRYIYGSANLVGRPGCVTFRGRCAFVVLPACSGHPGFYVGMKASLWGVRLMALPSTSRCFHFETFLRSACLEWLCQTLVAMQDIWVSLHSIRSKINRFLGSSSTNPGHRNFIYDIIDAFFK